MNVLFYLKVDCSEILCVGFSNPKNSVLPPSFLYMICIKSYPYVNINVENLCLNWNNLGIMNSIKILAAKSNSVGLNSL